ncbi:uncharacterized protein STEHIDRAFT_148053 [Stereum hirsutum FP-91666 SS1]|uniref:uncharacterized protein n=1 Tax=Stereum hirsutum (strain FP-91666) TaxID=721885 RepID=UPI000444A75A|nr:uncharacterized protein STEHIDRAFT_148053 [Stereum hirsutum FP-91666 SS1]EIM84682.1 hypothetical protein STEHIDRAFT_148053 [Stereum hirsutum FP-91666 SS1]
MLHNNLEVICTHSTDNTLPHYILSLCVSSESILVSSKHSSQSGIRFGASYRPKHLCSYRVHGR